MQGNTPPESIHALDIEALRSPEITFWSAWDGEALMGCAAIKELDYQHTELKSMRTASAYLRKGVAKELLEHILNVTKQRNYTRISLETGASDDFQPARNLYKNSGFSFCNPFSDYSEDVNSVFMTKSLIREK